MTIKAVRGDTGAEASFVSRSDMWPDEKLIINRMLTESDIGEELEIKMLDLPHLHQPNEKSAQALTKALSNCKDLSIFKY